MTGKRQQLELFGAGGDPTGEASGAHTESPRRVQHEALQRLGERMPPHVRLGTSSWTFPGWAGLVYHRHYSTRQAFTRQALAEYTEHPLMRTVGIDRSYYAPLIEQDLREYAAQLPDGFRCVMKVWQELTTLVFPQYRAYGERAGKPNARFLDPGIFFEHVAEPVRKAFGSHVGPLVLEIPPSRGRVDPRVFERALEIFLRAVPPRLSLAVELRDRRLLTDRYAAILREHGASHVFNFWSRMPSIGEQLDRVGLGAPFAVARLMLPPKARYDELKEAYAPFDRIVAPQPEMRRDVVRLCREAEGRSEVYVLVNNKAEGSAPQTVRALAELLTSPS